MPRILGIDYGAKRIGLAISDENRVLAFPKKIIINNQKVFEILQKIILEESITEIVIGDSLNFSNQDNLINVEIQEFSKKIKENLSLPIFFQKEFLTSVEARRYIKRNKVDSSAAALILQRFLDQRNNSQEKVDVV